MPMYDVTTATGDIFQVSGAAAYGAAIVEEITPNSSLTIWAGSSSGFTQDPRVLQVVRLDEVEDILEVPRIIDSPCDNETSGEVAAVAKLFECRKDLDQSLVASDPAQHRERQVITRRKPRRHRV